PLFSRWASFVRQFWRRVPSFYTKADRPRLRAAENKSPPIALAVRLSCIRMIRASANCLKFYYFFRGITLLGDVTAAGAGIVSAEHLRIFTDNDFKLGYFLRIKA